MRFNSRFLRGQPVLFRSIPSAPLKMALAFVVVANLLLAGSATAAGTVSEDPVEAKTKSKSKENAFPYMRMDFQVKASCVTCLRKVAKALKTTRGVINADVSIYYPHWAVVIIDTSATDPEKVIAKVKKEKADIDKLFKQDLKEKPIIVFPRSDTPVRL